MLLSVQSRNMIGFSQGMSSLPCMTENWQRLNWNSELTLSTSPPEKFIGLNAPGFLTSRTGIKICPQYLHWILAVGIIYVAIEQGDCMTYRSRPCFQSNNNDLSLVVQGIRVIISHFGPLSHTGGSLFVALCLNGLLDDLQPLSRLPMALILDMTCQSLSWSKIPGI